jgi:hypothetical protein
MKYKYYNRFYSREKVPRRVKKYFLGNKVKKSYLKKLLKNTIIIKHKYPESAQIWPYEYCPYCGTKGCFSTGNMASYPERYVCYTCMRCGKVVGGADNSPYYHVLEDIVPEDRHYNCGDDCLCKKDMSPDEYYWEKIVPNQYKEMSGIFK